MKKLICVFVLVIISVFSLVSCKADDYNKALELIEAGENEEAYELLKSVGFYKNARKMLKDFYFVPTQIVGNRSVLEISYDERHFPVKYILNISDGKNVYTADYEFDDNGFLLGTLENIFGKTETKYFYNRDGLLDHEVTYYVSGKQVLEKAKYTYDDDGNLIKKDYGDIKRVYEYDRKGKLVKAFSTTEEPYIEDKVITEYFYDSKGFLIKKSGDPLSKYDVSKFFYDSEGRRIKVMGRYAGEIETITSVYDDNGNLIREILDDSSDVNRYVDIVYECIYAPDLPSKIKARYDVNIWRNMYCWWNP